MPPPTGPSFPPLPLTADESFALAQSAHENNRLSEAESLYRAGLQLDSNHVACRHYLGVIVGQRGQWEEAERLIRSALADDPNSAEAHNSLGNLLAARQRRNEAAQEYRTAIALEPDHVEALNNLGVILLASRNLPGAISCFEQALANYSDLPETHVNLGNAHAALQGHEQAIAHYRQALALRPDFAVAHNNIGIALTALNRPAEALAEFERAIALNPLLAEAHHLLGNLLAAQKRYDEAIAHLQQSLAIRPESAAAENDLGAALVAIERHADAIPHYLRACALRPDYVEAHSNLGVALAALERYDEAMAHHERALALRPGFPEASVNRGYTLYALRRPADAVAAFEAALAGDPQRAEAHHGLGLAFQALGRLPDSRQSYTRAIELAPRRPEYFCNLSRVKKFAVDDPLLAAMEKLALDMEAFSETQQIELHFALGKALDDADQHERAFQHLLAGNSLKRRRLEYQEWVTVGGFDRLKAVVTSDVIHRMRGQGDPSEVPVFIVGMPRSGTTLVEQILASHPAVFGAGELSEIGQAVLALDATGRREKPFPELIPFLSRDELRRLGARYVAAVSAEAPRAARICDKMPGNFCYVGLIHLILPNARIIHLQRDPRDACFSCFSQLFAKGRLEWSYDLGEIGRYYRAYDAIMEHWRRVLPEGVMLEVRYEELVADLEPQARRIVAYCGLDWDERCLAFHRTQRPIWTASVAQVREPIYRRSIGRWQRYTKLLQPLFDELCPLPSD